MEGIGTILVIAGIGYALHVFLKNKIIGLFIPRAIRLFLPKKNTIKQLKTSVICIVLGILILGIS